MDKLSYELVKDLLTEAEEQYFWPRTILPKIKGSGYDSLKRAKSTISSIKNRAKLEQKEIVETMYNRAKYHDSQTGAMREAMEVFEHWLAEDSKKIKKVVGIMVVVINHLVYIIIKLLSG